MSWTIIIDVWDVVEEKPTPKRIDDLPPLIDTYAKLEFHAQGLPGSMNKVLTPILASQSLTALAVNSGPLSDIRERANFFLEKV